MNTQVGDLAGNVAKVQEWISMAAAEAADVAVFPELTITGYPPEDLLLKPGFIEDNLAALGGLAESVTGPVAAVVGFADGSSGAAYNALSCLAHGEVCSTYHKRALPNVAVFDEKRVFRSGVEAMRLHRIAGVKVGMSICEDAWIAGGPVPQLAAGGAQIVMNINASPFHRRKVPVRESEMRARIAEAGGIPLVYVNQVGGQDELLFDGSSMVLDSSGGKPPNAAVVGRLTSGSPARRCR